MFAIRTWQSREHALLCMCALMITCVVGVMTYEGLSATSADSSIRKKKEKRCCYLIWQRKDFANSILYYTGKALTTRLKYT